MPTPLTQAQAQHLADYVLERLADGLASNRGLTGEYLARAELSDVAIALQRLLGALAGDAAELRLVALLGLPADYLFGGPARCIAEGRRLAAADAAHRTQAEQVPA